MSGADGAPGFTPGPWECCPWGQTGFEIQGGGKGLAVVNQVQERRRAQQEELRAQRARRGEPGPDEWGAPDAGRAEALANARLMTAAPNLYAIVAELWDNAAETNAIGLYRVLIDDEMVVRIERALAKADGGGRPR